jgi:hypothetical protein
MAAVALFEWSRNHNKHKAERLKEVIDLSLLRITDRLSVIETKVEVFWRSVAINQASILHQPDPRRAHIDVLLEALKLGTLTHEQDVQLRHSLHLIRDWEPGKDVGFPVLQGEQTAASLLLSVMDIPDPPSFDVALKK